MQIDFIGPHPFLPATPVSSGLKTLTIYSRTVWRELLVPFLIQEIALLRSNASAKNKTNEAPGFSQHFYCGQNYVLKIKCNFDSVVFCLAYQDEKYRQHRLGKRENGDERNLQLVRLHVPHCWCGRRLDAVWKRWVCLMHRVACWEFLFYFIFSPNDVGSFPAGPSFSCTRVTVHFLSRLPAARRTKANTVVSTLLAWASGQ